MKLLELKLPPPLLLIIAAGLMWLCYSFYPQWNVSLPYHVVIAAVCFFISCLIALLAIIAFIRAKTSVNPFQVEQVSELVTSGVYRISRNPMYLSLTGILISWGLLLTNVLALCLPVLFILYITRFQIQPEEALLQQRFGRRFTLYKRQVRRWL